MNIDVFSLISGSIAILVSTLLSVFLLFGLYKLNLVVTRNVNEIEQLKKNNTSVGLMLGSVIVSEALLMRHAVIPVMSSIRNLFVTPHSGMTVFHVIGFSTAYMLIFSILAFVLVWLAMRLFSMMTRSLDERAEIGKDNLSVAIFFSAVIIAAALVIDQGMADLARSLILMPDSGTGIITLN